MPSFNKVILMGHLTRDPQLKFLPSQTALTEFGLACNRKFKTAAGEAKEEVLFVDCAAFGRTAEVINQYFTKGSAIFVEGRLKYDSWEDKQGGGKRSKLTVVVENFEFVGDRSGGKQEPEAGGAERPSSRPGRAEQRSRGPAEKQDRGRDEMPFGEEKVFAEADIPF